MTDDELDRALFALPLEEPPAELHGRIMAATVLHVAPTFRAWEIALLVAALAFVGAVTYWLFNSTPNAGSHMADDMVTALRALGLFSRNTYLWLAVGLSTTWWISSLPFMATPRRTVYNG